MMLTVEFKPLDADTAGGRHREFGLWSSRGLLAGVIDGDAPSWLSTLLNELNDLLDLQPGWSSYGARTVDSTAIVRAIELLGGVTSEVTPRPGVVPTSRGGVQLEWHTHDIDIEIEVVLRAATEMYFRDRRTNVEWEHDLDGNAVPLRTAVAEIAARSAPAA